MTQGIASIFLCVKCSYFEVCFNILVKICYKQHNVKSFNRPSGDDKIGMVWVYKGSSSKCLICPIYLCLLINKWCSQPCGGVLNLVITPPYFPLIVLLSQVPYHFINGCISILICILRKTGSLSHHIICQISLLHSFIQSPLKTIFTSNPYSPGIPWIQLMFIEGEVTKVT